MKKFCITVYLLIMALFVMTMSGCGGSSGGTTTQSTQSKQMIFKSRMLKRNGEYRLYSGSSLSTLEGITSQYYLAPGDSSGEEMVMNLEFASSVSENQPFMITDSEGQIVLFYYNPAGTGTDLTTQNVHHLGGNRLSYSNLSFNGSSVELDDSDVIDIVLNSDGTATAGGTTIPVHDYVWHADPQHPAEYWTLGIDGTTELDEDEYADAIEAAGTNNGIYIAHDIRYTPSGLGFTTSQTAKKDQDDEYIVYYDTTAPKVAAAIKALGETYGNAYSTDKYIFATLPMPNGGMGGNPNNGNTPGGPDNGGNNPGGPQNGGDTRMPVTPAMTASATDDSSIEAVSTMTHSATDAYSYPVLHITEPGTYRLSGTWQGQIWIETGAKAQHKVGLILNGVSVRCSVAPALVFYKVYKWAENGGQDYDQQSTLAANNLWQNLDEKMMNDDGDYEVGAIVEIADGTTNTFTGANVYRILKLSPKLDDDGNIKDESAIIGSDISAQQKLYKLDGAFHSRRTMVIGGASSGNGKLNITSTTCEGLDSEMHMLISGGNITVTAVDDGINVNEDYVSDFIMNDGSLTINSTNGDGIDSNGWISFKGGTLNITAGNQSQNANGESGIDAENDVYIYDSSAYTWTATNGSGGNNGGGNAPNSGGGDNTNNNTNNNGNTNNNTNTDNGNTNTDNGNSNNNSNNNGTNTNIDNNNSNNGTNNGNTNTDNGNSTNGNTNNGNNTNNNTNTDNGSTTTVQETSTTIDSSSGTVITLFPSAGSTAIEEDTETTPRNIPESSNSFKLVHRVNKFGGLQ